MNRSLLLLAALLAGPIAALRAQLSISVNGQTTTIPAAELASLPHQEVTAFDAHEKKSHAYSGVPARVLLEKAGVVFGEPLRGKRLREVVVAQTRDHYSIVYALAEFDPDFNPRTILVVDRQDGQPLPESQAPYRLLIPGDKRPARWARMLTGFEVRPIE